MTEPSDREPTLSDVIEKINKLAQDQERFNERFSNYHPGCSETLTD
ncbi:MAG: hypothetical protein LH647_08835 [Leptolyngbyaceae cyanobacterium CAN_BIN12]|nr:hypothetical protein [Leptolyngbyaceae cyanobacterium CAN_BIN12]